MLYVMFYAIVTSGPMAEDNNGKLNTIGLGPSLR